MCAKHCVYIYITRKDQTLRLTVNYKTVLNTMFEQNRKEVKVGWRKLLEMALHELYNMIGTLVTYWRASDDRDGAHRQHRREKEKAQMWEVYRMTMHNCKLMLVSTFLKQFKDKIFKHSMHSTNLAPSDYHLLLHIKIFLAGQRLRCDQNTKHVLRDWLKGLAAKFFEEGIQKLVSW